MKYIKAHNKIETFGEHLSNKKHIQKLQSLEKPCQQVLCVWGLTILLGATCAPLDH
jgi:hypothetical protein